MKFNTCPHCGDHLDFGERCDCQQRRSAAETREDGEELAGDKPTAAGGASPRLGDKTIGA